MATQFVRVKAPHPARSAGEIAQGPVRHLPVFSTETSPIGE
jgi:hypothetical protein